MQAKRAHLPVETAPWAEPAEPARPIAGAGERDANHASPALQLRAELAARLAELYHPEPQRLAVADAAALKLPVGARLAVIAGLSLACWAAIGVAVTQVL